MDRLKFRVWDNVDKKYIKTGVIKQEGYLAKPTMANDFDLSPIDDGRYFVEQCTGLKDKNGDLIYEGDFVDVLPEIDTTAVIEWSDDLARFTIIYENICCDFDNYYGYDLEIIGNIHENPELMEEVK